MAFLGLAPGLLIMATCFPFIVTVFSILRQAIGHEGRSEFYSTLEPGEVRGRKVGHRRWQFLLYGDADSASPPARSDVRDLQLLPRG